MRKWREEHPMTAAWNIHKWNAKQRGIKVEWNRQEFFLFCFLTGYHILRKDGLTIDRENCFLGYSLSNCQTLSHHENSIKGSIIERWLKHRKKVA